MTICAASGHKRLRFGMKAGGVHGHGAQARPAAEYAATRTGGPCVRASVHEKRRLGVHGRSGSGYFLKGLWFSRIALVKRVRTRFLDRAL